MRLTDRQLDDLKARHPVSEVAGHEVRLRRGSSRYGRDGFTGPCPICSTDTQKRSASKFECNADSWVCAVCADGGDVIRLKARLAGLDPKRDFARIVALLGGTAVDEITPAVAERHGRAAYRRGAADALPAEYETPALAGAWRKGWRAAHDQDEVARKYRERERGRLFKWWQDAADFPGSPVEHYLVADRGLLVPGNARLRYHPDIPHFADGREVEPRLLHRGPAMLAAIWSPHPDKPGVARFIGLHLTWLDPAGPKGKARIVDPETGEIAPSKKVRGGMAGGYIDLGGLPTAAGGCDRLFAGEGIETTLTPYTALVQAGRLRAGDCFRAGIALGNLAGKSLASLAHPTAKTALGRARRVPGPDPDLGSLAMPVPDTVTDLVGLGDGDSDPFLTRNALARFKARHTREGRTVRTPFAPAGKDFNDTLQGAIK